MAKDEDLEILGTVVAGANQETRECSNDQAEEKQHRRILGRGRRESGFLTPTGDVEPVRPWSSYIGDWRRRDSPSGGRVDVEWPALLISKECNAKFGLAGNCYLPCLRGPRPAPSRVRLPRGHCESELQTLPESEARLGMLEPIVAGQSDDRLMGRSVSAGDQMPLPLRMLTNCMPLIHHILVP
jgi:hypothetical protein